MTAFARFTLVFGLIASMVPSPSDAQDEKGKGKKKAAETAVVDQTFAIPKEITLTDDQKAKVDALKKEHGEKLLELSKKLNEGITPEQFKARRDAQAKAKADGKKQKEIQEESEKAMNLTDEQKKKRAELQPEMQKLQLSIKEKIHGLLTDDQKTHYKLPGKKKN